METEMVALDKTIDNLEERADKAEGERQVELRKEIAGLRTKYEQMERKLDELKAASGDTWASAKLSAEEAWNDLTSSVKKTSDNWDKDK
jgi:phage shock protein A